MKEIIRSIIRFKEMCDDITFETCVNEKCEYKDICKIITSSMPDSWNMKKIIELQKNI